MCIYLNVQTCEAIGILLSWLAYPVTIPTSVIHTERMETREIHSAQANFIEENYKILFNNYKCVQNS